jgi:putative phosphoribosyl transferase
MVVFADRREAGRQLARRLEHWRGQDVVVLGLPRGGVPVAYEVAKALGAPMDVIVVRKLGLPFQPEVAMGAIGEDGARMLNRHIVARAGVSTEEIEQVEARERAVLEDRIVRFRKGRERIDLAGRTALVVDDGIATGATANVACQVARHLGAARVVLAAPVAPPEAVEHAEGADEVVVMSMPRQFMAVGMHYNDFSPTSEEEVIALLDAAAAPREKDESASPDADEDVGIPVGDVILAGHLQVPPAATAVVVFAHGSGSSRHSPRNRYVASILQEAGLGTLLLDLLSVEEELDRANVFDIGLLADRLTAVTAWLGTRADTRACAVGYFGASTGAGAALLAAADPTSPVAAVVSRGGRVDLAAPRLGEVRAPTLMIVGSHDEYVLGLNRQAQAQMTCANRISVVLGATHLFEEPGTLAEAASLARDWFVEHLRR